MRTAQYRLTFPDDTPLKILRRGILSCSTETGNCMFVLMLPDDVGRWTEKQVIHSESHVMLSEAEEDRQTLLAKSKHPCS